MFGSLLFYCLWVVCVVVVFFFKQKTAYEMRISDWSSDVCSSDLLVVGQDRRRPAERIVPALIPLAGGRETAEIGDHRVRGLGDIIADGLVGAVGIADGQPDRPPLPPADGQPRPALDAAGAFCLDRPRRQIGRAHVCTPVTHA